MYMVAAATRETVCQQHCIPSRLFNKLLPCNRHRFLYCAYLRNKKTKKKHDCINRQTSCTLTVYACGQWYQSGVCNPAARDELCHIENSPAIYNSMQCETTATGQTCAISNYKLEELKTSVGAKSQCWTTACINSPIRLNGVRNWLADQTQLHI